MSSSSRTSKQRADLLVVELGLARSRTEAQALILAGQVLSPSGKIDKPGSLLDRKTPLEVAARDRFVSRGGHKLEGALEDFSFPVEGKVCLDIGAATGGFTDCLLQRGAARVYAVDVGWGQLAERLRKDPRVESRERTNARTLGPGDFAEPIELVVVDASFIGLGKLLPAIASILPPGGHLLALVKPQFEAGRQVANQARGVIRDEAVRKTILETTVNEILSSGFELLASSDSRLRGPKGNLEHFVLTRRRVSSRLPEE